MPNASKVIPKKDSGTLNNTPNIFNISTRICEMNHIQKIEIIKETKHKFYKFINIKINYYYNMTTRQSISISEYITKNTPEKKQDSYYSHS